MYSMTYYFTVASILAVFLGNSAVEGRRRWCRPNEVYLRCGTNCPKTCENQDEGIACIESCVRGCFCRDGYVRNDEGRCVRPSQCPPKTRRCSGPNEKYYRCIPCEKSCKDGKINYFCTYDCRPGCSCIDGYVKDENGQCVPEDECTPESCPENQQFYDCMPKCPNTCELWGQREYIRCGPCGSGCFCKENLVLRNDNKCVPYEQCNPSQCGANEEYKCGTKCPKTCKTLDAMIKCVPGCKRGCFCKDGFVRSDDDGSCIPTSKCPKRCPPDQTFYNCKPFCKNTCRNTFNPNAICPLICIPGCYCREGLVRDASGTCVEPLDCPREEITCPKDQKFYECMPNCENTCKSVLNPPAVCPRICEPGCFCNEGLVKDDNGKCVDPDECLEGQCGANEDYKCGTKCPKTCKTLDAMIKCKAGCNKGCFCKDGFVRSDDDGSCIPTSQCPERKCPKNQVWSCITICKGCAYYKSAGSCNEFWCNPGCECKDGYRRNSFNVCIPEEQCPLPVD